MAGSWLSERRVPPPFLPFSPRCLSADASPALSPAPACACQSACHRACKVQDGSRSICTMWKVSALLAAFFAALTAIFSKIGVRDIDASLATAVRVSFILLLTWGIVLASGTARSLRSISSHSLLFLFLSAMATGLSWLFYFKALQIGDVSKVAPIDKLSVTITIFLSIVFLGEPASLKTILGGLVITLGSLILLL